METDDSPVKNDNAPAGQQGTKAGKGRSALSSRIWTAFRRTGTVLAAVAAIGSVIGGLLTYFDVYSRLTSKPGQPVVQPARSPRILVLPLATGTSSDARESLFALGIARDAVAGLSRFPGIEVIGTSTATALGSMSGDHLALRQKYGITHVVSGSLHITSDAFRLNIELNETEGGTAMWTEGFEGPITGVVNVGNDVVRTVVGRVASAVRQADLKRSRAVSAETLSAYHLTLQGRQLWQRPQPDTLPQAQDLLAKAIAADPTYAPAYAYLAYTYLTSYNNSWSPGYEKRDTLLKMLEQASKALELDPEYGTAHTVQAIAYTYLGRHAEANAAAQQALKVNGSDADILTRVGQVLSFAGEHEQAIRHLNDAIALDPLGTAQRLNFLSRAYFFSGSYDSAIANARLCLERSKIEPCRETLVAALALSGQLQEAARTWKEIADRKKDADPAQIVSRLRSAFKQQHDLDKLVSGLAQARNAAGPAAAGISSTPR
jgi:adenylate cyclase